MASSDGTDASSNALRSAYDSIHVRLSPSHERRLTEQIGRNLKALAGYRVARLVLGYRAMGEELDVSAYLEEALADGKLVALPHMEGPRMVFGIVDDVRGLGSRAAGAASEGLDGYDLTHSVCLVPGLVFDAEGYRVGYGAGYLDNFLATYPGLKVGVVRGFNVSSNPLPHDEHDVPVDVLVNESAVWNCRR